MDEIFKLEYHPTDGLPRRIRFVVNGRGDRLELVTERRTSYDWEQIDAETVDYFEYSDE